MVPRENNWPGLGRVNSSSHFIREEKELTESAWMASGDLSLFRTSSLTVPFGSQYGRKLISQKKKKKSWDGYFLDS